MLKNVLNINNNSYLRTALRLGCAGGLAVAAVALPPRDPITGGPGGIQIDPGNPEDQPPTMPTIGFGGRGANAIRVRYNDNSTTETSFRIYRGAPGGNLSLIATLPAANGEADLSYLDTGLTPDTLYSYAVGAVNSNGERISPIESAYTRAAVDEPVWRVQLAVKVANREDAGMDGDLTVLLNSSNSAIVPSRNSTYLDYGRDDFERNSYFVYDLNIEQIQQRCDITQIQFRHGTDDAVCIESFGLFVNGVSVYAREFSDIGGCKWLDNNDTFTVSHEQLRADARWQTYTTPFPPLVIPRAELESRIESLMGDMLHGTDAYWGDKDGRAYVEASTLAADRMRVTLDLKGRVDNFFDPEVDISFDMVASVGCSPAGDVALTVTTENFDSSVSFGFLGDIVDFFSPIPVGLGLPCEGGLARCLERKIERAIEQQFVPISINISAEAPICDAGYTPTLEVTPNTDIVLGFTRNTTGRLFVFDPSLQFFTIGDSGSVPTTIVPMILPAGLPVSDPETAGGTDTIDPDAPAEETLPEVETTPSDGGTTDGPATDIPTSDEATPDGAASNGESTSGTGAATDSTAVDATEQSDAASDEAESLRSTAPMGCGGPLLLNGLMLAPALMSMRNGGKRSRARGR